jgi:hypothetical protein
MFSLLYSLALSKVASWMADRPPSQWADRDEVRRMIAAAIAAYDKSLPGGLGDIQARRG